MMACARSTYLCTIFALLLCASAETHVYESDFDTGIPGVSGHSTVVVRTSDSSATTGSEAFPTSNELLSWAMQQFDAMTKMHTDPHCGKSIPVVLVGGYPVMVDVDGDSFVDPMTSSSQISWTTNSGYGTDMLKESYLNEYDEYVEERQVTVHTSTMDYRVRRIILVFLMGICAIALFLCIQQARELKKAMEASARKGSYSTVITSKTPLLESLPHEGVQDGPVIAVATLK